MEIHQRDASGVFTEQKTWNVALQKNVALQRFPPTAWGTEGKEATEAEIGTDRDETE